MTNEVKIVYVEDDENLRNMMGRFLSRKGFLVFSAENGEDGLDLLRLHSKEITLMILDLNMPKITGMDVLKIKEEDPVLRLVPTIILSGCHDLDLTAKEYNVTHYVSKTSEPKELIIAINKITQNAYNGAG